MGVGGDYAFRRRFGSVCVASQGRGFDTWSICGRHLVDTMSIPRRYPIGLLRQCRHTAGRSLVIGGGTAGRSLAIAALCAAAALASVEVAIVATVGGERLAVLATKQRTRSRGAPPPPSPPARGINNVSTRWLHHIDHPGGPLNQHLGTGRAARHQWTAPCTTFPPSHCATLPPLSLRGGRGVWGSCPVHARGSQGEGRALAGLVWLPPSRRQHAHHQIFGGSGGP